MTKGELRELIKAVIREYTGTGASGGNSTDGNDIPSPRPFTDDEDEIENYAEKGAPYGGAEGNHYRKETEPINYNRPGAQSSGGPKFENKTHIKENTDNVFQEKAEEIWDGLIYNFRDNKNTRLEHLNQHYRTYAIMEIMRKLMGWRKI